jgi:hypothetical protein
MDGHLRMTIAWSGHYATALVFTYYMIMMTGLDCVPNQIPADKEKQGEIGGFVFTNTNAPLEGARVVATRTDGTGQALSCVTDAHGHFSLPVDLAEYIVVGMKEEDGYPDCRISLFSCVTSPYRTTSSNPSVLVNLQLNRAARITGEITDRATGKRIENASLLVRRADDYYKSASTAVRPDFSILVPSDVDVTLVIAALKYRLWKYRDPHTYFATLRLASGSEMKLQVQMDRVEP